MKKSELKTFIKPLIKECLKEVLVEEGLVKILSETRTQSEVIKKDNTTTDLKKLSSNNNVKQNLNEVRKKMLDEIGMNGFDAFSGTVPLSEGASVNIPSVSVTAFNSQDPGVDISKLMSNKLHATFNALNGKKVK